MYKRRLAFVAAALLLCAVVRCSAQITWEQDYRGRKVCCGVSGLQGFGDRCGFEDYEAAFVGQILSLKELPEDEFLLEVAPSEVFKGDLPSVIKITTRSGACWSEFRAGDEWLFTVNRDKTSHGFIFWFGTPGGPLPNSNVMVSRFRNLSQLNNTGLIRGTVSDEDTFSGKRRPKQEIVVRSLSDGTKHSTLTDADGNFEFPPLPVGKYSLDPNTVSGLWSGDGGETTVQAHECRDYHIAMRVDGSVAGTVTLPDGNTSRRWTVDAVPLDAPDTSGSDATTDDQGHFVIRGIKPGRYLIGIEVVGVASRYDLNFGVYAPGVRTRATAEVIDLGKGEKRTGVDIHLPGDSLKTEGANPRSHQPSPDPKVD